MKSSRLFIHSGCTFCQDLGSQEEILCHLNRCEQNSTIFNCHAFQPKLTLIDQSGRKAPSRPKNKIGEGGSEQWIDSDKVKYQRALALQKLSRYPDEVFLDIKFHFAWNVNHRKPVFTQPENAIEFISDALLNCCKTIGGFATPMWLAPDHIHLYVESDGEESLENMAQEMKRQTEECIFEHSPELVPSTGNKPVLWDKAYFVETLG